MDIHLSTISALLFPALADQLSVLVFIGACGWKEWKGHPEHLTPAAWITHLSSAAPKLSAESESGSYTSREKEHTTTK